MNWRKYFYPILTMPWWRW